MGADILFGGLNNPFYNVATKSPGFTSKPINYANSALFDSSGALVSSANMTVAQTLFSQVMAAVKTRQSLLAAGTDIALSQAIADALIPLKLTPAQQSLVNYQISVNLEHKYGGSIQSMSLRSFDTLSTRPFGSADRMVLGFDSICRDLLRNIRLLTNQVVVGVNYTATGVTVSTASGLIVSADYAIITLPLGVLKSGSVKFNPPLPTTKQTAINRLVPGLVDHLVLRFNTSYWPKSTEYFNYSADPSNPGLFSEIINVNYYDPSNAILSMFVVGQSLTSLNRLSETGVVAAAMQVLTKLFKNPLLPQPIASFYKRWSDDPMTMGSFSLLGVNATISDRAALAAPVMSRVFFAGEACSVSNPNSVDGAYDTGLDAARAISGVAGGR